MGGQRPPRDNSAAVAQIEADAAREAREAEERRKAEELAAFEQRLGSAHNNAINNAMTYFTGRGVNADDYVDEISQRAASIRSSVPQLDSAPGSYYDNLGQLVYEAEQDAMRQGHLRNIDTFAPANFAVRRIADTSDDAVIDSILEDRQNQAEQYARNLLDRGVITQSGYSAALDDIAGQRAGARSQLAELGLAELETGRGNLRNIASDARSTASNLNLGAQFDPFYYQQQIDQSASDFFSGLGDRIRGAAPKDIFQTSGLAGIAGAAQGAQNTAFNPNAIAGIEDEEEDDDETTNSPF